MRVFVLWFFVLLLLALPATLVSARGKKDEGMTTIRDEETESYLRTLAKPIFDAAGLSSKQVNMYIVSSDVLNAFVAGGQNIFMHTELILQDPDDPAMLMGVIAHETGHISGGHLSRSQQEASNAMLQQALGYLVGIGAVVAGAPSEAVVAAASGGQHLATQNFLAYSRSHEQAADQAGVKYLEKIHVSPKGLMELLGVLWEQQRLALGDINPYAQTHPLSQERIEFIRNELANNPVADVATPEAMKAAHQRIVAKLYGFLKPPAKTLSVYNKDLPYHRYARAIAYFKDNKLAKALELINGLIAESPNDAYYHELKGQMLFENGKLPEAQKSYERAVALHDTPLMKFNLAMVYMAEEKFKESLPLLEHMVTIERKNGYAWDRLGITYGRLGQEGDAYWALAHKALLRTEGKDLRLYIARGKAALPEGSKRRKDLEDMEKQLRRIE